MWAKPDKAQEYLQMNIDLMEKRNADDKAMREADEGSKKEKEDTYF